MPQWELVSGAAPLQALILLCSHRLGLTKEFSDRAHRWVSSNLRQPKPRLEEEDSSEANLSSQILPLIRFKEAFLEVIPNWEMIKFLVPRQLQLKLGFLKLLWNNRHNLQLKEDSVRTMGKAPIKQVHRASSNKINPTISDKVPSQDSKCRVRPLLHNRMSQERSQAKWFLGQSTCTSSKSKSYHC